MIKIDYDKYFDNVIKIKNYANKNRTKISAIYLIKDETFNVLMFDIILFDMKYKKKVDDFIKKENIIAKINFFIDDEYKTYLQSLTKDELFNNMVESWVLFGHAYTMDCFKILKEKYFNESVIFNGKPILIKDMIFSIRTSAGALIYNPKLNKFLIIKHNKESEDYWNLPKGGIEEGENVFDTIKREVFEETGLSKIKIYPNLCFTSMHNCSSDKANNDLRKVYGFYYPAVTNEENIKLSNEHCDALWLSFEDIKNKITFPIGKYNVELLGSYILKKNINSTNITK